MKGILTKTIITLIFCILIAGDSIGQNCIAGHYKLDASAMDNSGNSKNGTLNGTNPTKDRLDYNNSALYFNGNGDYVRLGSAFDFKERSISLWFKADTFPAAGAAIYACDNNNLNYGMTGITAIRSSGKNELGIAVGNDRINTSKSLKTLTWYHVTLVISNSSIKLFINGQLSDSIRNSNNYLKSSSGDSYARLGTARAGGYYLKGLIDEVKIFDCPISNKLVSDLYKNQSCLMAWYKLDGDAKDSSGNKRNGIMKGTSTDNDRNGHSKKAISFNGNGDHITLGSSFDFPERTFSLWLKADSFPTTAGAVYACDNNTLKYGMTGITVLNQSGINQIRLTVGANSSNYTYAKVNTWYHAGIVVNNTSVKFFINGQMIDSIANNSFSKSTDGDLVAHLGSSRKNEYFFKGSIDEVKISDCAWSNKEMSMQFDNYNYDAGVVQLTSPVNQFCAGNQTVSVKVRNFGKITLDSVSIGWSVNGSIQKPYLAVFSLKKDSITDIKIGSYQFNKGFNKIKTWTYSPNSITDSMASNDTLEIGLFTSPLTDAGSNKTICENDSVEIGLSNTTGHAYEWTSAPSGFNSTVPVLNVRPSKTTTYYLKETVVKTGCYNTDSIIIKVNPAPKAITGNDTSICEGNSVKIGHTRTPNNNYSWSSYPFGFSSSLSNPTVTPTETTTYYLSEIDSTTGCLNNAEITITVNPLPLAQPGSAATVCNGTTINLGTSDTKGNSYSWTSRPSGFTSFISNPSFAPSATATYFLSETILSTGCTKSDSVKITVLAAPVAYVRPDTVICIGESLQLGTTAVSGNIYSWSSNPTGFNNNLSNPLVTPGKSIKYTLTETIVATGCSKTRTVDILVNTKPKATVGPNQTICKESSVSIGTNAVPGNVYTWVSNPKGFTSNFAKPTFTPLVKTTFILKEYDPNTGCSHIDSMIVNVNPIPTAKVGRDTTICKGQSTVIGSTGITGNNYVWESSPVGFNSISANPKVTPGVKTTYYLTESIKTTGCSKKDYVTVDLFPQPNSKFTVSINGAMVIFKAKDSSNLSASSFRWELGDGNYKNGYNAKYVYAKNQTYTVKLIVTSSDGCNSESDTSITVMLSGINNFTQSNKFINVSPNPVKDIIHLTIKKEGLFHLTLYNTSGQVVLEKVVKGMQDESIAREWPAGFYYLKVIDRNGLSETRKLILE
jgi:hypothetical protein